MMVNLKYQGDSEKEYHFTFDNKYIKYTYSDNFINGKYVSLQNNK